MSDFDRRMATFVLLILVLVILIFYFSPLLDGIALGIVFAYVARPIMKRIPIKRKGPSAILATIAVVAPISLILIFSLYDLGLWAMSEWESAFEMIVVAFQQLPEPLQGFLEILPTGMGREFLTVDRASSIIMLILNFLLSTLLCYYLLVDGKKVAEFMTDLFHVEDKGLVATCDNAISGIYIGSVYTAFIVAVMTVPFLLIFRIPHPLAILGLMFLAALIPVLAEWMILLIPLAHLVLREAPLTLSMTFIITGSIFLYILPELVIRPWLTGRRGRIHPFLMLLAFIGGGISGGVAGFFLAPMFAGILVTVYRSRKTDDRI